MIAACQITWPEAAVWIVLTVVGTLAIMFLGLTAYIGTLPGRARRKQEQVP